jgi:hypothetical protein
MKKLTLFIALMFSQLNFAQTDNYIEITVGEAVKLSAKSVVVQLYVNSAQQQLDNEFYYNSYEEEYSESDYYYHMQMEEDPKKVTKAMKKEYERSLVERQARMEELETARANYLANNIFKPNDLRALLTENGITFKEQKMKEHQRYSDEDMSYEPQDNMYFEIVITDAETMVKLADLVEDFPVERITSKMEYESFQVKKVLTINSLSQKAREEATVIANSINRKIGKVISCSDVISNEKKYEMQSLLEQEYYYEDDSYSDSAYPFSEKSEHFIIYVYRFELVN